MRRTHETNAIETEQATVKAQSWCRYGRGEPNTGADVAVGASVAVTGRWRWRWRGRGRGRGLWCSAHARLGVELLKQEILVADCHRDVVQARVRRQYTLLCGKRIGSDVQHAESETAMTR